MSVSSWGLYRGRVRERPGGTVEPWLVEEGGGDGGRWKEADASLCQASPTLGDGLDWRNIQTQLLLRRMEDTGSAKIDKASRIVGGTPDNQRV